MKNLNRKAISKGILKHLGRVGLALISASFVLSSPPVPIAGALEPVEAAEVASELVGVENAKSILNETLKVTKSKPALLLAGGITCMACLPVAGAAGSPALCIACGILIAKTVGI